MARTLQHFELEVLLAMLRQGGETYSVPLVLELEQRAGAPVAPAKVFIALTRLERRGLVVSRMDEPEGGRARRYFKVTEPAIALVKQTRDAHSRLWQGVDRVLRRHKG
jgi:PadR family transcriptional regulator, regulatory protein PadR